MKDPTLLDLCEKLLWHLEVEQTFPTATHPARGTPAQFEGQTVVRAARAAISKARAESAAPLVGGAGTR